MVTEHGQTDIGVVASEMKNSTRHVTAGTEYIHRDDLAHALYIKLPLAPGIAMTDEPGNLLFLAFKDFF